MRAVEGVPGVDVVSFVRVGFDSFDIGRVFGLGLGDDVFGVRGQGGFEGLGLGIGAGGGGFENAQFGQRLGEGEDGGQAGGLEDLFLAAFGVAAGVGEDGFVGVDAFGAVDDVDGVFDVAAAGFVLEVFGFLDEQFEGGGGEDLGFVGGGFLGHGEGV